MSTTVKLTVYILVGLIVVSIFGIFAPVIFRMDGFDGGFAISAAFMVLSIAGVISIVAVLARWKKNKKNHNQRTPLLDGIKTSISKADLVQRISSYFGSTNYKIISQTDSTVVLQGGKAIDGCLFVLLLLLLLIGSLIYWAMAKSRQIVINWEASNGFLIVKATGNTNEAQVEAISFLTTLPTGAPVAPVLSNTAQSVSTSQFSETTLFCHKCGSKLTTEMDFCSKCGTKLIKPQ